MLCAAALTAVSQTTLFAAAADDGTLGIRMALFQKDAFTVDTETFRYATGYSGMTVNSDLLDLNAEDTVLMVSGLLYEEGAISNVCLTTITENNDDHIGERGIMFHPEELGDYQSLQVGDLLRCRVVGVMDSVPLYFSVESVEKIGSGEELFGTAFRRVIRHEFLTDQEVVTAADPATATFDFVTGDLTEDDAVDIMDAISLNKYLLGASRLTCYQTLTADVDRNAALDATDSLMILKEVVGITTDFVETP